MSEKSRSFFGTIPGVVTGLAGLLTAVVGLITLLVQLDVIGGDDSGGSAAVNAGTTTTLVAGGAGARTTPEAGTFSVNVTTLNFGPADPKEKTLTVKNTSAAGTLKIQSPRVTGKDAKVFDVSTGDCNGPLAAGLSCTLRVTFVPSGGLRSYEATVQIQAADAARAAEVKLTGNTLL